MTYIQCNAVTCAYNQDRGCALCDIHVMGTNACRSRETCCESFAPARETMSVGNDKCDGAMVECDVKNCVHNCNGECCAENVSISGCSAGSSCDTQCDTFTKK